jgi:hypothetical protein
MQGFSLQIKDGLMHGPGKMFLEGGRVFIGEFK